MKSRAGGPWLGLTIVIGVFLAAGLAARADDTEKRVGNGLIDWRHGSIRVTGAGAPGNASSISQRRLMVKRAAQADAYRQLAEIVNGVQVTSETDVKDFVTQSDTIRTRVSAVIKGMMPAGAPRYLSDGSVEIDLKMPLYGNKSLADALDLPAIIEREEEQPVPQAALPAWVVAATDLGTWLQVAGEPASVPPAEAPSPAAGITGLIVDGTELGAEPAMGPVVIGGPKRIYPGGQLHFDHKLVVARGIVHYADSLEEARKDQQRVGGNPLLVRAKAAIGRSHSDLLIDDQSARRILEADEQFKFLKDMKVAIVV